MPDNTSFKVHTDEVAETPPVRLQKWGGLASFLLVVAFIVAPLIYLMGDLRSALGRLSYDLADFLYGPVWAASLVTSFLALRERIGGQASRRTSLALMVTILAAGTMVLVTCIRASNRHYHIIHPELQLESSITVLTVWTTLIAGVTAAGWHFLGWALVLFGSAGWTSGRIPRALSVLYIVGGFAALIVYLFPAFEGTANVLGVVWGVWQGILLWMG